MTATCLLHRAFGREEICPGEACGLWDDGCTIAALKPDLSEHRELAAYLLELREQLEQLGA